MKAVLLRSMRISLCTLLFSLITCKHSITPVDLYGFTRGYFDWVSTTTPSGIITPQMVGYTKQLAQAIEDNPKGWDRSLNYVAFYKNDTLQHRYNEITNQHYIGDARNNRLFVKYDTVGYLTYYLSPNTAQDNYIQISEFHVTANYAIDTVKSLYKRNVGLKLSLYPY
ncbi:hypothetical protein [Spirosoma koreense]